MERSPNLILVMQRSPGLILVMERSPDLIGKKSLINIRKTYYLSWININQGTKS